MYPSPRICKRIQNLTIDVSLSSHSLQPWARFIGLIDHFGDPAIIRGTFSIHFRLFLCSQRRFCPNLNWSLQCLRRFANFRFVNVDLVNELETELITAMHYSFVENALGSRLGPATRHATGIGFPRRNFCMRSDRGEMPIRWIFWTESVSIRTKMTPQMGLSRGRSNLFFGAGREIESQGFGIVSIHNFFCGLLSKLFEVGVKRSLQSSGNT